MQEEQAQKKLGSIELRVEDRPPRIKPKPMRLGRKRENIASSGV